jgi:hypothetical protein
MSNPWSTASETITQFISLDKGLARDIGELVQQQARDAKLDFAVESGRTFGVRRVHSQMLQQQALNKQLQEDPITAPGW